MHYNVAFLHHMTMLDWNDLRTLAEVARRGSLASAARALGVHPTTIARRISAAEDALGAPLFLRGGKTLTLTPAGSRIVASLDPLVEAVDDVARRAARKSDLPVRIAATENGARILTRHALPILLREEPTIDVEILAGNELLDLGRGEADLAIRVVEPSASDLVRKRLGTSRHGLYASPGYLAKAPPLVEGFAGHTILAPAGPLAQIGEARYLAEHASKARVGLRCSSLVALAVAAEEGGGLVVLPTNLAEFHPALVLVRRLHEIEPRAIWLVMHRDARRDPRVRHVASVVERVTREAFSSAA